MYFKTKLKNLLTLGSSNVFASIIGGLFWLYLASFLEKTEYGELGFLMSFATVASVVSLLGLGTVTVVYGAKKENVFPSSYILILISSSIVALFSYFLTHNVTISFLIIGMTSFELIIQGLLSKQRYNIFSKYLLIKATVSVTLALVFYQFLGINGILLGYFLGSLILLIELRPLLKNKKIEFSLLKPKIRFMLQAYATRLSLVIFWWGDKLLIGAWFGFTLLGSYYFAAQYLMLIDTIPRSITQYLLPQESTGTKNKKIKILSILLASLIALISIIFVPFGIEAYFPQFEESIFPIQIMSIAIIPITISQIQMTEFLGKENTRIVLIGSVFQAGLYLLLLIPLGQNFALTGIAVGLVFAAISRTIFNLIMGMHLQKQTPLS